MAAQRSAVDAVIDEVGDDQGAPEDIADTPPPSSESRQSTSAVQRARKRKRDRAVLELAAGATRPSERPARVSERASTRQARPERPSGSELRGLRSREGGTMCDHRRRAPAPLSDAGGARAEPGAARASAQLATRGRGRTSAASRRERNRAKNSSFTSLRRHVRGPNCRFCTTRSNRVRPARTGASARRSST